MIQSWQLQDAKNRLSQLVEDALRNGPQLITRRGAEVAVVLSYSEYQQLIAKQEKISHFFQNSPLVDTDIDLTRDTSVLRDSFEL